ncbi:MAG: NTP transferase domain-containing protein [Flavobacteriaceae bacterium]
MKIVILAAGIGSRLGNPFPKPLTKLNNGKSIMEMQINNITSRFDIDDINVVVGFKKDLIMERFPNLTYIYNPFFDRTNTSKSLLSALKKNKNSSILWFNGDVVFDEKIFDILTKLIERNKSFVAVNTNKVGDEEVKYTLKNGFIHELSKTVKNGIGEAVGINFISSNDIESFIKNLIKCDDNDYFEKGLELCISDDNKKIKAVDISDFNCMEIDFIEDLHEANKNL